MNISLGGDYLAALKTFSKVKPMNGRINDVAHAIAAILVVKNHVERAICSCDLSTGHLCERCFDLGFLNEASRALLKVERAMIEDKEGEEENPECA